MTVLSETLTISAPLSNDGRCLKLGFHIHGQTRLRCISSPSLGKLPLASTDLLASRGPFSCAEDRTLSGCSGAVRVAVHPTLTLPCRSDLTTLP